MRSYKTVYRGGEGETVEKKSRFIATVRPVKTEEEASLFIEEMKKKYWDATHNCSAYVIGKNQELMRCSDDGEPSQTAGRPMLDVLLGEGLCNVCVVVTRYFGGTLLGTGGLVRAYAKAVQEGLAESVVIEKKAAVELSVGCDYTTIGKIQYIIGQMGLTVTGSEYTDVVSTNVLVPVGEADEVIKKITEVTNARAGIERVREIYFSVVDKETIIFEE